MVGLDAAYPVDTHPDIGHSGIELPDAAVDFASFVGSAELDSSVAAASAGASVVALVADAVVEQKGSVSQAVVSFALSHA